MLKKGGRALEKKRREGRPRRSSFLPKRLLVWEKIFVYLTI